MEIQSYSMTLFLISHRMREHYAKSITLESQFNLDSNVKMNLDMDMDMDIDFKNENSTIPNAFKFTPSSTSQKRKSRK